MTGLRRTIVVAFSTVLVAAGGAALTAPAASAAPPQEFTVHWDHALVADIRDRIAADDTACNVTGLVGGTAIGAAAGNTAGFVAGVASLVCGSRNQGLRAAVDEAYWRNCGIDAYYTLGEGVYDTTLRTVATCP